jgi:hypothetical protein
MANGWGGKRQGAGRAADAAITAARIGLELFQSECRQHKSEILARFLQLVMQDDDRKLALDAGLAVLAYGFGKPRETIMLEGEVVTRHEYGSFDELKQVLIERGLPVDRLLEAQSLDLTAEAVNEHEQRERDT